MKCLLEQVAVQTAPGPSSSFSIVHVIKAIEQIAESPIGRNKLSERLAIGKGATRTLIRRLKEHELAGTDRRGCFLSKKGEEVWRVLHEALPSRATLDRSRLTLGEFNIAVLVKGRGSMIMGGMEQRDAALMVGARGATTLVFKDGDLTVPPNHTSVAEEFPSIHRRIMGTLKPEENDAVIVGSADSLEKAEYGALAAAWTLLEDGDDDASK